MLHYQFPRISTIDDVLPHIEGRSEFNVLERDDHVVIAYAVQTPETFEWDDADPTGSSIRRECRGIIFESGGLGRIIRRPFHKFKNINEDRHHQSYLIDTDREHTIRPKIDGSMIAPFIKPSTGRVVYGTKRGITDIGNDAERFAHNDLSPEFHNWVHQQLVSGYTPLFEWISPTNRIVLEYERSDLVLLGLRNMVTGEYVFDISNIGYPREAVSNVQLADTGVDHIMQVSRNLVDEEGYVLTFRDGHMIKFKGEWYLNIHKLKDDINSDRKLIRLMLSGQLDDVISQLPEYDQNSIKERIALFWQVFNNKVNSLKEMVSDMNARYGNDRKRIATQYMIDKDALTKSVLFESISRKHTINDIMMGRVSKIVDRTDRAYDQFMSWMMAG